MAILNLNEQKIELLQHQGHRWKQGAEKPVVPHLWKHSRCVKVNIRQSKFDYGDPTFTQRNFYCMSKAVSTRTKTAIHCTLIPGFLDGNGPTAVT